MPLPSTAEVSELWHLLFDDPVAGTALAGEVLGEAYDDLVEDDAGLVRRARPGRPHGARRGGAPAARRAAPG